VDGGGMESTKKYSEVEERVLKSTMKWKEEY
jgi:hypothetical protein